MDIPIFSLVGPAIRSEIYRDFYNSWAQTKIPFEVIFVGNSAPIEPMPNNFKYIYTKVKPAQCWEIAARHAMGKYLIPLQDDIRVSPNFLERAYNYVIRYPDTYTLAFMHKYDGEIVRRPSYFDKKIPLSPIVAVSGIFEKEIWTKLGGLDRRFTYAMADVDMQMRFMETGRPLFIIPDCIFEELEENYGVRCCDATDRHGRTIINHLWVKENRSRNGWEKLAKMRNSGRYIVSKTRLHPVEPFVDDNILLHNQGPEGIWTTKK